MANRCTGPPMRPLPMKPTVVMPMANPGRAPGNPGCRFLALDYQSVPGTNAWIMKMIKPRSTRPAGALGVTIAAAGTAGLTRYVCLHRHVGPTDSAPGPV